MLGTGGFPDGFDSAGFLAAPFTFIPGVDFFPAKGRGVDGGASIFFAGVHFGLSCAGGVVNVADVEGRDGSSTSIGVTSKRRSTG